MYAPDSHTALNITQFAREGLSEYGLTLDQIASFTTDSAANMIAACRELKVTCVSCFRHILHNTTTTTMDADQEVVELLKACRKIVSVFRSSC